MFSLPYDNIKKKKEKKSSKRNLRNIDEWTALTSTGQTARILKMASSLKADDRAEYRFRSYLVAVTSFTLKGRCSRAKGVSCIFKGQFKRRTMALPPYDGTVLCDTSFSYSFPGALLLRTHELVSPGAASKHLPCHLSRSKYFREIATNPGVNESRRALSKIFVRFKYLSWEMVMRTGFFCRPL